VVASPSSEPVLSTVIMALAKRFGHAAPRGLKRRGLTEVVGA